MIKRFIMKINAEFALFTWSCSNKICTHELFGFRSKILPLEDEGGGLAGRIWDLGQGSDFSSAYKARPALPQPLSMKQSVSEISALL